MTKPGHINTPRPISEPRPGYFKVRRQRGGDWLPAIIYELCLCQVNGGEQGEPHEWKDTCDRRGTLVAEVDGEPDDLDDVWTHGHEIEEWYFQYLKHWLAYKRGTSPLQKMKAEPVKKVDPRDAPPEY